MRAELPSYHTFDSTQVACYARLSAPLPPARCRSFGSRKQLPQADLETGQYVATVKQARDVVDPALVSVYLEDAWVFVFVSACVAAGGVALVRFHRAFVQGILAMRHEIQPSFDAGEYGALFDRLAVAIGVVFAVCGVGGVILGVLLA